MKSLKRLIVFMFLIPFLFILETEEGMSEENIVDVCPAKQRVVYTDGVESWLMAGDPEQNAVRYSQGRALPTLLSEGWKIVSVTGASNANTGKGKTLIVLDISVIPYDQELTIMEGEQARFPCTSITVSFSRTELREPNPNYNPNERAPDPRGPYLRKGAVTVQVLFDDKQLERTGETLPVNKPWSLDEPWNLKNGYSLQVVNKTVSDEMLSLTFRLYSN